MSEIRNGKKKNSKGRERKGNRGRTWVSIVCGNGREVGKGHCYVHVSCG